MTAEEAKLLVLETGKELLQSELNIHLWGSVSVRIDSENFAINSLAFFRENLNPLKNVNALNAVSVLKINDSDRIFSFKSEVNKKASSKNGSTRALIKASLHSQIYAQNNSVNFIIQTRQKFASAIAGAFEKIPVDRENYKEVLGDFIPCVKYADFTSKEFTQNILAYTKSETPKALLLANHGVICFGKTKEEAVLIAQTLDKFCHDLIFSLNYGLAFDQFNYEKDTLQPFFNFYASKRVGDFCFIHHFSGTMIICKMDIETGAIVEGDFDFPADLHRAIYLERPEINFIEQCVMPASFYVSKKLKEKSVMPAFLDDFAKKAGANIFYSPFFENRADKLTPEIVALLKDRNAVIIGESGILCCAKKASEMTRLKEIVEKNSLAMISSLKLQNYPPLKPCIAKKLRKKYLKS